jgi:hypothetical protein
MKVKVEGSGVSSGDFPPKQDMFYTFSRPIHGPMKDGLMHT